MGPNRAEAVFFDVGGTLVRIEPRADVIWARALEAHGYAIPPEEVIRRTGMRGPEVNRTDLHRAVAATSDEGPAAPPPRDETGEAALLRRRDAAVLERLGVPAREDLLDTVDRRFRSDPTARPYDDAVPALQRLQDEGYRLGVISNASHRLPQGLADLDLARFFAAVTYSSEVGVEKPHPRIFRTALARLGVEAPSAVHVGDSYEADVVGARRVGITPVLVARVGSEQQRDCAVVGRLTELADFLAGDLSKG